MKKLAFLLVVLATSLPIASAQNFYLGAELAQLVTADSDNYLDRDLGAQLGLNLGPGLSLRAAVAGNLQQQTLGSGSLDALVSLPLFGTENNLYLGAGADVFDINSLGTLQAEGALPEGAFGAHAVAGAEMRLGPFGVFAELQPVARLEPDFTLEDGYFLRTRAGLNLHF